MVDRLLHWNTDREAICRDISGRKSTLKLLLKTRDEPELLTGWVEHHARIVGMENLIIADNESEMPETVNMLHDLAAQCCVFTFSGFHNELHRPKSFPELYAAIRTASECFLPVDTDERLYWIEQDRWIADHQLVERIHERLPFDILPAALVDNAPQQEKRFLFSTQRQNWSAYVLWGKPVVRNTLDFFGASRLHNCQFQARNQIATGEVNLFCVHLTALRAEWRLRAHRRKLAARGVVPEDIPFEKINEVIDMSAADDVVVRRVARDVAEILKSMDSASPSTAHERPRNSVELAEDGRVNFGSDEVRLAFRTMVEQGPELLSAALLADGDTAETPDTDHAERAPINVRGQTEAELRSGMEAHPRSVDAYGDPAYRKELIRLLLAEGRWDEAEALIPEPGSFGAAGWYHILFARALDGAGHQEEALQHWQAFAETRPNHPEVIDALNRDTNGKASGTSETTANS